MKKIILSLFSVIMVLSLIGCGGSGGLKSIKDSKKVFKDHGFEVKDIGEEALKEQNAVAGVNYLNEEDEESASLGYAEFKNEEDAKKEMDVIVSGEDVGEALKDGKDGLSGTHKVVDMGIINMNIVQKDKYLLIIMNLKHEKAIKIAKDLGF